MADGRFLRGSCYALPSAMLVGRTREHLRMTDHGSSVH
jgi:hypothetical protein